MTDQASPTKGDITTGDLKLVAERAAREVLMLGQFGLAHEVIEVALMQERLRCLKILARNFPASDGTSPATELDFKILNTILEISNGVEA